MSGVDESEANVNERSVGVRFHRRLWGGRWGRKPPSVPLADQFFSSGNEGGVLVYTTLMYTHPFGSNMAVIITDHTGEAYECTGWKKQPSVAAVGIDVRYQA